MSKQPKADRTSDGVPAADAQPGPTTTGSILESFEARVTPFSPVEVSSALGRLRRELDDAGQDILFDLQAEWLAATFIPDYVGQGGKRSAWGTYYGPVSGAPGRDGNWIGFPGIDEVTPEVLEYWDRRAREARHPTLRARYGDVAWDFGRRLKIDVSSDLPRIAIDATVECAEQKLFEHCVEGFRQLDRALRLALSLRDAERIARVANTLIAYEDQTAEDRLAGTWGFAFDTLVQNRPKGLVLPVEVTEKIVADLEGRLARLTQPVEPGTLAEPFKVERAAARLASYYRKVGRTADVRRVLGIYGDAFGQASQNASANLAAGWLERVADVYRDFDLHAEADALAVVIQELGPRRVSEMKPVSSSVEIPMDEVERYIAPITTGTIEQVLVKIAAHFFPRRASWRSKSTKWRASRCSVLGSLDNSSTMMAVWLRRWDLWTRTGRVIWFSNQHRPWL